MAYTQLTMKYGVNSVSNFERHIPAELISEESDKITAIIDFAYSLDIPQGSYDALIHSMNRIIFPEKYPMCGCTACLEYKKRIG